MRIFYHIPRIPVQGPNAYANALANQLLFDVFYCIQFYLKSLLFDKEPETSTKMTNVNRRQASFIDVI